MKTKKQEKLHGRAGFLLLVAAVAWCLLMVPFTATATATVRASLDRTRAHVGDTITLTIEADDQQQGGQPDIASLQKNFQVLGTSTGRQVQIFNGHRQDKSLWYVQLEPKGTGRLTIPPIRINGEQTAPLTLEVSEASDQVADASGGRLFLEAETRQESRPPYVQQEIRYTIRLLFDLPLLEGSLTDPAPENAVVERLGEDKQYETRRDGRDFQVIERSYVIFPEKSGELRIPPVRFHGKVAVSDRHSRSRGRTGSMIDRFFSNQGLSDPFANDPLFHDGFMAGAFAGNAGEPISARSKAVALQIEPRPAGYAGKYWLPTEQLVLRDSWADKPPEFRAGEPVTRTITIEAKGLAASQIPQLKVAAPDTVRIYPEQPVLKNRVNGNWIYGRSEQRFTYIPSQSGPLTLPATQLTWWDTEANKQREAELPGWKGSVLPGAAGPDGRVAAQAPVARPAAGEAGKISGSEKGVAALPRPGAKVWAVGRRFWPWSALAGLLLLLTGAWWWRGRRPLSKALETTAASGKAARPAVSPAETKKALRKLHRACERNDSEAASQALLQFGAARWPENPPRSLGALASRLQFGSESVRELDRVLYAPNKLAWDGSSLSRRFRREIKEDAAEGKARDRGLDPLYPQHT